MNEIKTQKNKTAIEKAEERHVLHPFEEMERLFENFSTKGWLRPFHWDAPLMEEFITSSATKLPSVDVIDRDDEILVKAELPGVEKKDLDLSVTRNSVTIKGSTRHEEKEEKGDYYRCEISRGSYMRTVALPADVDEKKSKASFKDGVLEITLPKMEKSHRHSIKVD